MSMAKYNKSTARLGPDPFDPKSPPTFCFISGASRGIGRAMAVAVASCLPKDSTLVLTGRDPKRIDESVTLAKGAATTENLTVIGEPQDLYQIHDGAIKDFVDNRLFSKHKIDSKSFGQMILVHNAFSIGDMARWQLEYDDSKYLENHFNCTLVSPLLLNNALFAHFKDVSLTQTIVVNVTSKMSAKPYPSATLYCTAKTARDMMFRVLASEYSHLRVVNYGPGPVDTEMAKEVSKTSINKPFAERMGDPKVLLKPEFTAQKFVELLRRNNFQSGMFLEVHEVS